MVIIQIFALVTIIVPDNIVSAQIRLTSGVCWIHMYWIWADTVAVWDNNGVCVKCWICVFVGFLVWLDWLDCSLSGIYF